MTLLSRFLAAPLLAALFVPATPAIADRVHPTPREVRALGGTVTIAPDADIDTRGDGVSAAAVGLLRERLSGLDRGVDSPGLLIGTRDAPGVDALLEEVPEVSGAYRLMISRERIILAGHDPRGTYYAALTLARLLDLGGNEVPVTDIRDWPEVPERGVVEGFYGTPWPHAKRLRLIEFLGEHKMNTYIYGPKDDPYHSSPRWREPYPDREAGNIRELSSTAADHHVDFYWAIHPGKDIRWTEEDYRNVLEKFEAMYSLGVRAFAVFFDDISGEGTSARRQADLLNRLHHDFVSEKGDVQPLVMCPTQYNRAWSGGDYLDTLGTTLDPSIRVMWTGNTVVADLDRPSMEWINARLRRRAYIWWNFPVSDYVRDHLLMGPVYGNSTDIGPLYGGFVSNPMERAEASRVALFGVADYAWNPEQYDSEAAFLAAVREIMPGAPGAFETFCRHNSDLGPNNHGYRRRESEHFSPHAEAFMTALRRGEEPDPSTVRAEFGAIASAPARIREAADNPALIEEISPWLDAFAQLGRAGIAALDATSAMASERPTEAWRHLAEAHSALAEIKRIDRTRNRNPHQPGVETGSLVITPMVEDLVSILDARFLSAVSGHEILHPSGITSCADKSTLPRMLDGRDDTFFYCKEVQEAGDWFGVALGGPREVRRVRVLLGRDDEDHDRVHAGVLEGKTGDSWETIARVESARIDATLDPPRKFRALRVRIEEPGSPEKPDLWTAIRTFEINPVNAAALRTDLAPYESQPVRLDEGTYSISPSLEVHSFPPGKFLGLLLPETAPVTAFEVDLKVASPARHFTLEATQGGRDWRTLPINTNGTLMRAEPDAPVAAVRVRNTGGETLSTTLATFSLTTESAADPLEALTDGRLDTSIEVKPDTVIPPPVGEKPTSVTLLPGPVWQGNARVTAIVGRDRRPLGELSAQPSRFALPAGTSGIVFAADADPVALSEVVWHTP